MQIYSENPYVTGEKDTVKCTVQISTQNNSQLFVEFGQMVECSFKNCLVLGSSPDTVTSSSNFALASSKEFLDNQETIVCGFTLKVRT